ncbi:MAG TPA: hypothetical protein VG676_08110 [Chitinophagaceae bacterium]|jgi:glycerol-3-phosphate O-acyltransferase|nr:hypothetical protein [Chitinophagaceae bacterium]
MYIEINDNTRIGDIETVFSNFYPYLQIGFYKRSHERYEMSDEKDLINPDVRVSDIKQTHISGILEIRPLFTIAAVEKEFLQRFGLSVQILWKEKNHWEQTTDMDDFTLKELNEMGRSSSDAFILEDLDEGPEELPTPSDFH